LGKTGGKETTLKSRLRGAQKTKLTFDNRSLPEIVVIKAYKREEKVLEGTAHEQGDGEETALAPLCIITAEGKREQK